MSRKSNILQNAGSKNEAIFGTPQEPVFNSTRSEDFPEVLQEWLINLAMRNCQEIQQACVPHGLFKQGAAAAFLFLVCDKLQLPWQVQFTAIELFDRFMRKHIEDLYMYVYNNSSKPAAKVTEWRSIVERVEKQLVLRIVSCCQIASKLNSHYEVITVSRAKRFLLDFGFNYSNDSVLQSELRVLKTVNFDVNVSSPLDYVETLLQVLAHNAAAFDLPISLYQSVATKLLTILYIRSNHIFVSLLPQAGLTSTTLQQRLSAIQADKLLMGLAVIAAAVYICDKQHTDLVFERWIGEMQSVQSQVIQRI
ncbi:cyclin N-terminal domain-containing protein 1-like isoform X3 [Pomacea canaliculata]|uniref:cyclin N-terminal domain-containing protein 1-like isoform X3 n=1 Tax=Pomacea canaliculata TaxID=400727 RepID=UPI000D738E3D|nr:cyclin N-terminal domain-containing protein 1-like isoform X3 [Pomacea canaliculata]XP_025080528.1 cyclin N-terminal domain-containing protein 1-like isoform X3 [Pomacea canaliculata]